MRSLGFFLLFILTFSCSEKMGENITKSKEVEGKQLKGSTALIGKWKLEEIDYSQFLSEQSKEVRATFEDEMKISFEKLRNRTFFEFKNDQVLKVEEPDDSGKQSINFAKWKMNNRADSLVLYFTEEENYKIVKLNSSELVLSTEESPKRILYFSRIF